MDQDAEGDMSRDMDVDAGRNARQRAGRDVDANGAGDTGGPS